MLIKLPDIWIAVINVLSWPVIMVTVSFLILKIDWQRFNPQEPMFKKRSWEREGSLYIKVFYVKKWKRLLPDGAAWFSGGFEKKRLVFRNADYFKRFAYEACRAETSHWISLGFIPIFFLYNPWWAGIIMSVFGLFLNIPCIIAQRYNRIQLIRLMHKV